MKLLINIPEEFEIDFKNDRFFECFSRIRTAASKDDTNIAGNYEYETFDMLLNAFDRAITDKELLQHINKESIYLNIEVNAKFVALEDLKEILEN